MRGRDGIIINAPVERLWIFTEHVPGKRSAPGIFEDNGPRRRNVLITVEHIR